MASLLTDGSNPSDIGDNNNIKEAEECCVCVAVHVRPLIDGELYDGCQNCLTTFPKEPQVQVDKRSFTYDYVYGWDAARPDTLYNQCVLPLVSGLFKGYNATVFAYGQTGSGKTYTMGSAFTPGRASSGVIPQAMEDIFTRIQASADAEFVVRVGFVEIYQESIRDLLLPESGPHATVEIQIREDGTGGICLAGATDRQVESKAEMAALLEQGALLRATGATGMNRHSSRSHAIFTITVEQRRLARAPAEGSQGGDDLEAEGTAGMDDYLCAKMHLVDLAGSERLGRTQAEADRRAEGIAINKGLLSLGKVINALAEGLPHVPYRDSKLTRMLQDSLGGNSRTVMIACVSPADINLEETLSTLRYAARARAIRNKPVVNRDPAAAAIAHLRQQLAAARAEIVALRRELGRATGDVGPGWDVPGQTGAAVRSMSDEVLAAALEEEQLRRAELERDASRLRLTLADVKQEVEAVSYALVDAQAARDAALQKLAALANCAGPDACAAVGIDASVEGDDAIVRRHLERIAALEREVRRLKKVQKLSGAMVVNARRQSLGVSPSPLKPTLEGSPRLPTVPPINLALDSAPSADASSLDELAEDEQFALSEQAHMAEQARALRELEGLQRALEAREAQMAAIQSSSSVLAIKASYERLVSELAVERDELQRERQQLLQKMRALQQSSAADRQVVEERYKKRLLDMDARLKEVKQKERRAQQAEALHARSLQTVARLEGDIQGIKAQKVQLQRQMEGAARDFAVLKKEREREVLQLRRQERKTAVQVQKLEAAREKQQAVLRRKTEEAEAARKRLKDLVEVHRAGQEKRERTVAASKGAPQGIEVQPNNAAPLLRDERARREWVEQELDMCCQTIDLQRVLNGEKAQRADVARRLADLDKRSQLGEAAPESQQQRQQLLAQQQKLSAQVAETQVALVKARQEEVRSSANSLVGGPGPDVQRWMALKSIAEARSMLQTLFRAAAQQKAQMFEVQQSLASVRDEAEEQRERAEAAEAEAERSRQATAQAQDAAAQAFAHAGTTPRSHASPVSRRRDSVEEEFESLMMEIKGFKQDAQRVPSRETSGDGGPSAANDRGSSRLPVAPHPVTAALAAPPNQCPDDGGSCTDGDGGSVLVGASSEDEGTEGESEEAGSDRDSEEDDVWRPETATPAWRHASRRSRHGGRRTGSGRSLASALDLARGSAGQAPGTRDLEQGEEQVLEAINRERTGAGRSPAGKLTVPLLKEHLRGKVLGGAAVRPGAKKRDELIGAFREYLGLPVAGRDELGQAAQVAATFLRQAGSPAADLSDGVPAPQKEVTGEGLLQPGNMPPLEQVAESPRIQPAHVPGPQAADEANMHGGDMPCGADQRNGATPLARRAASDQDTAPLTPAATFYLKQWTDTLDRVQKLNGKINGPRAGAPGPRGDTTRRSTSTIGRQASSQGSGHALNISRSMGTSLPLPGHAHRSS